MFVISSSAGNDSLAMIQWAHENDLCNRGQVHVVFSDTGWAAPGWLTRVSRIHAYAESLGMHTHMIQSIGMQELVRIKDGFPGNAQQFCTAHLKGIPFLQWIDEVDPFLVGTVMVGKRRVESEKRKDTPEFIYDSDFHGGRTLWHPLFLHTDEERDALIHRAGFVPLPHRSLECNPCVNANRADFLRLTPGEIERVNDLEVEIGRPMFRPKRFGAMGIHGVIVWAKDGRKRGDFSEEDSQCSSNFGCGY